MGNNMIETVVVLTVSFLISIATQAFWGIETGMFTFAIGYTLSLAIQANNRSLKIQEQLKLDLDE